MLKAKDKLPTEQNVKFSDTTREEVSLLGTAGIISGYEDGTFKPNNSITREEASMLLYKTAQYIGYNDFYEDYKLSDYKYVDDEEIGEWAKEAVYQMNKAEIMTGMGDDMFSPKSNYTNEQSISTIMRLYDLQNKPKSTPRHFSSDILSRQKYRQQRKQTFPKQTAEKQQFKKINKKVSSTEDTFFERRYILLF